MLWQMESFMCLAKMVMAARVLDTETKSSFLQPCILVIAGEYPNVTVTYTTRMARNLNETKNFCIRMQRVVSNLPCRKFIAFLR